MDKKELAIKILKILKINYDTDKYTATELLNNEINEEQLGCSEKKIAITINELIVDGLIYASKQSIDERTEKVTFVVSEGFEITRRGIEYVEENN